MWTKDCCLVIIMSTTEAGVSFRCTTTYECQNEVGYAATTDLQHVTNELFRIGHMTQVE